MEDTNPFPTDHGMEQDFPSAEEPTMEPPPVLGGDERRMHVRAYNYWVSLLDGRPYPSIDDLDPDSLDFGSNSVLLDFTSGPDNAAIPFLGDALREEGGLSQDIRSITDVPPRSVLSRLTDHYLEILANRAPIGFEAEYVSHRQVCTMYRGILMPFSSNGDEIDFIYGVINWKDVVEVEIEDDVRNAIKQALTDTSPLAPQSPVWADGPHALHRQDEVAQFGMPPLDPIGFDAGDLLATGSALYDRLAIARESAEALSFSDQRSRAALYAALGQAYDFAVAAEDNPHGYAEILDDAGLKAQERAPMTPLVKLIFGVTYDKTRLAEYAAVLSYGRRQHIPTGSMPLFLERYDGGLKAVVKAERVLRRPAERPDRDAPIRLALAAAPALGTVRIDDAVGEFVALVARREHDGSLSIISASAADDVQLRRVARHLKH